ncbi:MAG: NAD(P)H-hydrate dehydratase [Candidatus Micrarchaeota archaeon]|nr:NAD(P)H-hydrate dehydratase [Candidatus Micrarchaeota archaeon]
MDSLLCSLRPEKSSHKGQNGVVLIIGGSRTYHGAPVLAARAAVRFCDLVYFASTKENNTLVQKMKLSTANVICVPKSKFNFALSHATCVLVGNGMDVNASTRAAVSRVLKSRKRCVVDAAALRVLPLGLLHKGAILTPHAREFEAAFGIRASEENAGRMAKKYGCTILLKGESDVVASGKRLVKVKGGNAGMTKGGTGDVLAGLCAAIFSRCDSPLRAAYTASRLNKRAGELLYKHYRYNFSSEDLAGELAYAAVHMP